MVVKEVGDKHDALSVGHFKVPRKSDDVGAVATHRELGGGAAIKEADLGALDLGPFGKSVLKDLCELGLRDLGVSVGVEFPFDGFSHRPLDGGCAVFQVLVGMGMIGPKEQRTQSTQTKQKM